MLLNRQDQLPLQPILKSVHVQCLKLCTALLFDDEVRLADEVVHYEVLRTVVYDFFAVERENHLAFDALGSESQDGFNREMTANSLRLQLPSHALYNMQSTRL